MVCSTRLTTTMSWQKRRNVLISKQRYKVERMFRKCRDGLVRYVGIAKTPTQHVLEGITHNLKRSLGFSGSMAEVRLMME
ncbi:MAG: hypothetical protein OXH57_12125 [Ekhidna sp.]|nr:hypothetical protein [Ekhidna sp.]